MPNVGDTFDETIKLGPKLTLRVTTWSTGLVSAGAPGPGEYTFTYRITRLPPRPALF